MSLFLTSCITDINIKMDLDELSKPGEEIRTRSSKKKLISAVDEEDEDFNPESGLAGERRVLGEEFKRAAVEYSRQHGLQQAAEKVADFRF